MKKIALVFAGILVISLAMGNQGVHALALGTNITIWDKVGVFNEDNEVEPNCVQGQIWDLEGFFINTGTKNFYMVGGYDFKNGVQGWAPGDIFFGPSTAKYGEDIGGGGNSVVSNVWGYTYALRLDFLNFTWNLYQLTNDTLINVFYGQNAEANPWKVNTLPAVHKSGSFKYYEGKTDSDLGGAVTGWPGSGLHNVVEIPYLGSGLPLFNQYLIHYTYQCGNDNLMGRVTSSTQIPEPSTLVLLGVGLVGLGIWRKKRTK